ncbi:MAG: hypothetical protein J6N79_02590 [Psychrobacter sp.]|uniref:hypothetical protein n=1 Tax=uncultured Psychrobacter sp. TaxID=259303 RepID=UPI001B08C16E|nr:hypothetical protein [uncultured Psychrobacter sp.]MBO6198465.1 hypothetical protein [Psychrobacter sp.]MBP8032825.1 hypothetical protein [Psychrobacter sp.]
MKTDIFTLVKSKPSFKAISITLLGLSLLSACQKTPESETAEETAADTTTQTTPVSSNINAPKVAETKPSATDSAATLEQDTSSNESENELSAADISTSSAAIMPNPEQAIKGAQITDVNYRSASGETLFVIFETSEKGVLNAIVTLPNKPKMTLSAPEGQGNNPTYRSNDGSIQLVSHGGGSSIDLIQNNKTTSFEAISVEAEVITE